MTHIYFFKKTLITIQSAAAPTPSPSSLCPHLGCHPPTRAATSPHNPTRTAPPSPFSSPHPCPFAHPPCPCPRPRSHKQQGVECGLGGGPRQCRRGREGTGATEGTGPKEGSGAAKGTGTVGGAGVGRRAQRRQMVREPRWQWQMAKELRW